LRDTREVVRVEIPRFWRAVAGIGIATTLQACTLVGFSSAPAPVGTEGTGGDAGDEAVTPGGAPVPDDIASIPDAVPRQETQTRSGNPEKYSEFGVEYRVLETSEGYDQEGVASWYGPGFHGKRTSSGEPYDQNAMTAAHTILPLPTYVEVTNLENGRKVVVRVNDRGPFHGGRIIDLSYVAAMKLGIVQAGTARVRVRALDPPARVRGSDVREPLSPGGLSR
jgi:peptidoglycan lytic transglycosylase